MRTPTPILYFVDSFNVGGAERQFVNLVGAIPESEFEVHVACFRDEGGLRADLPPGAPPVSKYRVWRLASLQTLRELARLRRYLVRHRIELVHSISFYPNVFAIPAAALARTPVRIASVRDMGTVWTAAQRRLQRQACRFASSVVVNAAAVAARLRREGLGLSQIEVIRNGIDLSPALRPAPAERRRLRSELGVPDDVPLVGVICRLHRVKRLEDFVDAAAQVAQRHPRARFLIVGPTDGYLHREIYAAELAERARAAGVGERLLFVGGRSDVPSVLAELSVSVLCSESEGLSNALLESMAAELPVVATRTGGNPEVVADGVTGRLVPVGAAGELAAAISDLLDRPESAKQMGVAGRRRVEQFFGRERMVEETLQLYRRLLAAHRGRELAPVAIPSTRSVAP